MTGRFWSMPIALALALGAAGCAGLFGGPIAPPPPEADIMERETFVIGHADVLRISVWKNDELSVPAIPVRPDGKISVPLLDDVQAAGLTPEELKELLTKSLAEFVTNPDVTVLVTQVNSKRIYVMGGIGRTGAQPLNRDMRVLDAISVAGGFTPFAKKGSVRILRRSGGGLVEYRFDYDEYLEGNDLESNMLLRPGDTIVVPD
jgi:polysaccharide export outer membrane protein